MTPNELHDYLLNLKNKNSQSPHIAEYKKTIREELRAYRSDQPTLLSTQLDYPKDGKDIVFYSFMDAPTKPKIAAHEMKRLRLSWSSLRKYNTDIEVRFCYDGVDPEWYKLCEQYGIKICLLYTSDAADE